MRSGASNLARWPCLVGHDRKASCHAGNCAVIYPEWLLNSSDSNEQALVSVPTPLQTASHTEKYALVVVTQIGQVVGEIREVIAQTNLEVIAEIA